MKGANGYITYIKTMTYSCIKKISELAIMIALIMVGLTFISCGGDDSDPDNDIPSGVERSGEFVVEGKYNCSDINYGYWYNNEDGKINLTFFNFKATSISNIPENIHAITIGLPMSELKEGTYDCFFEFDANANSDGGCSLYAYNSTVVITKVNNYWSVYALGSDGTYQTFNPETYSKNEKFSFAYIGSIEYNKLLEE